MGTSPERGYGYCKLQNCGRAPKPAGAQMTLPTAMDAEQQATGCGVLSTRFWPHSGPVFPCYTSILPFQMGLFNSLFYIASCTLFLDFKRAHSKVITLSLGRDFGVLNSVELLNYKDLRSWRGCLLNTETAIGLQGPRRNITDWVWSIPHRFMYLNIWSPICDAVFFWGEGFLYLYKVGSIWVVDKWALWVIARLQVQLELYGFWDVTKELLHVLETMDQVQRPPHFFTLVTVPSQTWSQVSCSSNMESDSFEEGTPQWGPKMIPYLIFLLMGLSVQGSGAFMIPESWVLGTL